MIVLDEQISHELLRDALSRWYPGKIIYLRELRPSTIIKDPAARSLLLEVKQPTFVTINYKDFWRKIAAHRGYCVVCLQLEGDEWKEVSPILREILSMPEFKTKNSRMGKVISWRDGKVTYYGK